MAEERIQKIMAEQGLCSRRAAEQIIAEGRVKVNGHPVTLGDKMDPDFDKVSIDGKSVRIVRKRQYTYLMLNKPRGYVTTLSDERGRKTAAELVADCGRRVFPVGRLDKDSEGLLLFTNDGTLAQQLLHPRHQVDKVYQVTVSGALEGAEERLSRMRMLEQPETAAESAVAAPVQPVSRLRNWPVQIKLAPIHAPYFEGAKLLIAADCTAYAYANFHQEFMRGKVTLIGCPKLDAVDYSEKLTEILRSNDIQSVTILRMEVPCCGGLEMAAKKALQTSGKFIPWQVVTISIDGKILD